MSLFEAIILGIVQGLTEFLPVSSSGHLELGKALLGDTSLPQESMMFTVVVHFATALATLVIYRSEVARISAGLMAFKNNDEFQFSMKILLSMIPAAAVGVFFADEIERLFDRQITLVGAMLLLTGGLLLIADRAKNTTKNVGFGHSIVIGIAQAIAILPGISRSGATISTSVILGIDRSKAASFSFLMAVPIILGKVAKDLFDNSFSISDGQAGILLAGFLTAFITGLVACQWMIKLVKDAKLKYFSYYCFLVGSVAIGYQLYS
ncbi:undecaprenyl-diphosphate phosphatase [Porticoccaceae bacterium]|nr:undecaprenyl-diphosphate phosphatase [Porticoccaceae bacterium]MDA8652223.1 undecaprenyl-diphosphate phosphatase [Porticoccaceae bacterium]MDA8788618.1 undecaprenyl-diphosphate phosphatase [Porticoccaceae bacterium]MDB2633907.1 undecaprenyl-diphosphate phosphatase [Porticoccaceae bacterium]MDB2664488.1 undecaprenyl-diphosphate phosphatase [Porticoccaceae bacterium]